jgi:hypothetical protein
VDLTDHSTPTPWFQWVTAQSFLCPEEAPMIRATVGQIWVGAQQDEADTECWTCDAGSSCSLGYRNDLCQRMDSPMIAYAPGEPVTVSFAYFSDCEGGVFDYTEVQLVAVDEMLQELATLSLTSIGGRLGSPQEPDSCVVTATAEEIPPATMFVKVRFRFTSDGGWSDEDGLFCSTYGPFAADNVGVAFGGVEVAWFDFDSGPQGWEGSDCSPEPVGEFVAVHPLSYYEILDPCGCGLEGNVLTFHDEAGSHPPGMSSMAMSPVVDRTAYPAPEYNVVLATFDVYEYLLYSNGVLWRPGWFYYPWECPASGYTGWSPRVGQSVWYTSDQAMCLSFVSSATEEGVPAEADYYRFCIEVRNCCDIFGLAGPLRNETLLFDNIRVGLTHAPYAPIISIADGCRFQDGFSQGGLLDPSDPGRSDVWLDRDYGPGITLGDSLVVEGPEVSPAPWEVRLWFRVARKGPGIDTGAFEAWKARFSGDPETEFVSAVMDTVEMVWPVPNQRCSYFDETDPGFDPAHPELSDGNEILPDGLFTPGTKIEYFLTARYVEGPESYYLPDTAGGRFLEFEILPSMRFDGQGPDIVWPCLLYVDAYNRGAQRFIQPALESLPWDVPGPGPDADRYDMLGIGSNYSGSSFARNGNNGATLQQLLGYRALLLNTGNFTTGIGEAERAALMDWLVTTAGPWRQGLILNGEAVSSLVPDFAGVTCRPYWEEGCPAGTPADLSPCVQIIDAGGAYPPELDYWGWGTWCGDWGITPDFSVLFPLGNGIGNRSYFDYDFSGPKGIVDYAQVLVDNSGGDANYRVVVDGYS